MILSPRIFILGFSWLFSLFILEQLQETYKNSTSFFNKETLKHIKTNAQLAFVNSVIYGSINLFCLELIAYNNLYLKWGLFSYLQIPWQISWQISWQMPRWIQTVLSILILDFLLYFWHFLMHQNHTLWRFHLVHHLDTSLDFSSAHRFHLGELLLSLCFHLPFYLILGLQVNDILIFQLILLFILPFSHSKIRLNEKVSLYLEKIIVTPSFHALHHSVEIKNQHHNFGTILSIWDNMLKSWKSGLQAKPIKTGVNKNKSYKVNTLSLIKAPFCFFKS